MNLQKLSDVEFEQSFHRAVKTERKIMNIVILHVQEVERRQLHLAKASGSLLKYLINEMKYSKTAANRRIDAAKLATEIPAIIRRLEEGSLNLSQIGELHSAVEKAKKVHGEEVTTSFKIKMLEAICKQSTDETQKLCAEMLDIPVVQHDSVKVQKDGSRRVTFTMTAEQFAKFEAVRDLTAHRNLQAKRTQKMGDVLETSFDELLSAKSPKSKLVSSKKELKPVSSDTEAMMSSDTEQKVSPRVTDGRVGSFKKSVVSDKKPVKKKQSAKTTWHSLTPKRKSVVLQEDECCQYENYETGKICGSTFNLHVDHIIPKWAGGSNDPSNLRVLCRAHNLFRERRTMAMTIPECLRP